MTIMTINLLIIRYKEIQSWAHVTPSNLLI